MSEFTKTGIFAGGAVVALILAIVASSGGRTALDADDAQVDLFPDFDPDKATSMEIVKFDEDTSTLHRFKVAQLQSGLWVIPSHNDYPADANTQLADVANSVYRVPRGPKVSDNRTSHTTYGVLEPSEELDAGAKGVGELIVFEDKDGKKLAELIVGKEVKDRFGLRYVRLRGKDRVYQVKIDSGKLSTKFEDWIEDDLLKLQSYDVRKLMIDDYSAEPARDLFRGTVTLKRTRNDQLLLKHDDSATDSRWTLEGLAAGAELEDSKLNDLTSALRDLKIVDVHPKPDGLRDFLAGKTKGLSSRADIESLARHGFFPAPDGTLACSSGEVLVEMKDGILYHLRFGSIAEKTLGQKEDEKKQPEDKLPEKKDAEKKDAEKKDAEKEDGEKKDAEKKDAEKKDAEKKDAEKEDGEKKDPMKDPADKQDPQENDADPAGKMKSEKSESAEGANRYLFVSVVFNEDLVEKPKKKRLPGDSLLKGDAPSLKEEAKKKAATKDKAEGAKKDGEKETETKKEVGEPKAASDEPALADPIKELLRLNEEGLIDQAELDAQRKEVQRENEREVDRYKTALEDGEKKEKQLNERFAGWYYVIDDEMYKKILVKRAGITKKPEKEEKKKDGEKKDGEKKDAGEAKTP